MRIKAAGLLCLTSVLGWAQFAQRVQQDGDTVTVTMGAPMLQAIPGIRGAPYSADRASEHTQTLADGTHLTQTSPTQHIYRDSLGRTREERPLLALPGQGKDWPMLAVIRDPVAGFIYVLDDQNRIAHRYTMTPAPVGGAGMGARPATKRAEPDPNAPTQSIEKLGTQEMEGLTVEGTRFSTTYPAGSQGNDRPMTNSGETWRSTDLRLVVLSKFSSARNGDNTTRLTNISRAEPDAALFAPPPDYQMVDEKDKFTMTLRRVQ